jgi:hypothetical protein
MNWTFRLNLTNGTDHELTVDSPDLRWGIWWTGGKDNSKPVSIAPGQTVFALGCRAHKGPQGYEFSCTWLDKSNPSYGAITLDLDVPWAKDNTSKLTVGGLYRVDGWNDLPKDGHNFVRNITVTAAVGAQRATSDVGEEDDPDYLRFLEMRVADNELVRDWRKLETTLEEVEQFDAAATMPDRYLYPPKEFFVARGPVIDIAPALWDGIGDELLDTPYAKKVSAARYFAAPIYSINTDPRAAEPIAAGVGKTTMHSVEVSSNIRATLTRTSSIKASLTTKATNKALGLEIAAAIEAAIGVVSVREDSTGRITRETTTIDIKPADHDRLFVPWVFSTAAAIYCQNKRGEFRLVAISQWATLQLFRTYEV